MRKALSLVLAVALSACLPASSKTEGGIIETTEAQSLAETGFPNDAVLMTRWSTLDDGTTLRAVQFDSALATQAMIDAAPSALCESVGLSLVSSRSFSANSDYIEVADTNVIEAICK